MNLSDCYLEEDLFPKIFTDYEERDYQSPEWARTTNLLLFGGAYDGN